MEQLEYITYNAIMECSCGCAPGMFTPTYNKTVKINNCVVATEADKICETNIPSFIVCKITQKQCTVISTIWQDTYPVKVKGQKVLIGKSCMNCNVGGKITFRSSGQEPLALNEQEELNSIRDNVQHTFTKELKEKNKPWWQKVGEFAFDMVPVVGPAISLIKNISEGNWGMAALDVGFLALDIVSVVGAPFTGGGSLAASAVAKATIRSAVKAGAKKVARALTRDAIETAARKTGELLTKLSVRSLTRGRLCVFACFPAGTPVATKDGLKNIEDVKVGDEVWSCDEVSGEIGLKPVLNIIEREVHTIVELTIDGEIIRTTPEHPFYANREWKEAGLLETDDNILLFSGRLAKVENVQYQHRNVEEHIATNGNRDVIADETTGIVQVYNFEVQDWHSYFIGWIQALVHNAGGICAKQIIKELREGKKLREILLGTTPGKISKTGREVIERMYKEGTIKIRQGVLKFKSKVDGKLHDLEYADMAHIEDAVTWWNQIGKKFGARSKEVREWMLNPANYYLELAKYNRAAGAELAKRGIKYIIG